MHIEVIRIDGTREVHNGDFAEAKKLIGADYIDTVNLRDGRVMLVDDLGYDTKTVERLPGPHGEFIMELVPTTARKPVNAEATKLYHGVCIPGTTHQIVGDVAIVIDSEL